MLVWSELGLGKVPGCGVDSGCGQAADSVFGKLPVIGWPVSYLGFAYFAAMAAAWLVHTRGVNIGVKAMAALGGLASLFYGVVIIANLDQYFCPWCATAHVANLVFVGALLARSKAAAPTPLFSVVLAGAVFLITTGALAGTNAWAEAKQQADQKQEEDDTIAGLVSGENQTPTAPSASGTTEGTAGQTQSAADRPLPAGWLPGPDPEVGEPMPGLAVQAYKTDELGFTGRYRLGPRDAKFRIVAFSSYQCEYCATFEKEVFEILAERDDVSFSHRHFPLDQSCNPHVIRTRHAASCTAAKLAEGVGLLYGPAAFWEIHKFLFDHIRSGSDQPIDIPGEFRARGYDLAAVQGLLRSEQLSTYITRDADAAFGYGLRQTPFVFVNGVELTYRSVGSLRRVIEEADRQGIEPATAENDRPIGAIDKFVNDYINGRQRLRSMGEDTVVSHLGPAGAKAHLQVFLCLEEPNSVPVIDSLFTLTERYPDDLRITFRHFPLNESCNFFANTERYLKTCDMHNALESAARLGGNEAFERMLRWIQSNRSRFTGSRLDEAAQAAGLDPEMLRAEMASEEPGNAILRDANFLNEQNLRASRPVIFLDNKRVSTYSFEGDDISVLDGVIRSVLGLPR